MYAYVYIHLCLYICVEFPLNDHQGPHIYKAPSTNDLRAYLVDRLGI